MLRRLKDLSLCVLSALLLIFSFPDLNIWQFAWFGFVPVFLALKNKSGKSAFFLFFLTGIIFWAGVIYWLAHVTLAGTAVLILYLALYFALFGLLIRPLTVNSTFLSLFYIPSIWVLLEFVRGKLFTGFPWALLGYSQYKNIPLIQIADITGAWGVSFLVMFVNVAIVEIAWLLRKGPSFRLKATFAILVLFVSLALSYGYFNLSSRPPSITAHTSSLRVSVVQGNIPQEKKWDRLFMQDILDKYAGLTRAAALNSPDLIIWPEAASPGILGEDDWVFKQIFSLAKEINIPLLVGSVVNDRGNFFGSALLISGSGEITGRYDKIHRVPFGEYIPLRRALPFLEAIVPIGQIEAGRDHIIFQISGHNPKVTSKFAVLDCFEDVFPELAREFTKRGANFLVNITNDAWYKETSAPFQHLQASVFRAVENKRPLARCANTGVSGFISASGEVLSLVGEGKGKHIFIEGFDTYSITADIQKNTFYTIYGDVFIFICSIFFFCAIIPQIKLKK